MGRMPYGLADPDKGVGVGDSKINRRMHNCWAYPDVTSSTD